VYAPVDSVSLNESAITIGFGATRQLNATVLPPNANPALNWTSSDPLVATVDSTGLVTARALGTATITATSTADGTKSATCVVTVNLGDAVTLGGTYNINLASGASVIPGTGVSIISVFTTQDFSGSSIGNTPINGNSGTWSVTIPKQSGNVYLRVRLGSDNSLMYYSGPSCPGNADKNDINIDVTSVVFSGIQNVRVNGFPVTPNGSIIITAYATPDFSGRSLGLTSPLSGDSWSMDIQPRSGGDVYFRVEAILGPNTYYYFDSKISRPGNSAQSDIIINLNEFPMTLSGTITINAGATTPVGGYSLVAYKGDTILSQSALSGTFPGSDTWSAQIPITGAATIKFKASVMTAVPVPTQVTIEVPTQVFISAADITAGSKTGIDLGSVTFP
jgi:hypothetical protein